MTLQRELLLNQAATEREKREQHVKRLEAKLRELDEKRRSQESEIESVQQALVDSSSALERAEKKAESLRASQRERQEQRQRERDRQRERKKELLCPRNAVRVTLRYVLHSD